MEYANLGSSGIKVSPIALGTMGFGDGSRGEWAPRWAAEPRVDFDGRPLGSTATSRLSTRRADRESPRCVHADDRSCLGAEEPRCGRPIVGVTKEHHLPDAVAALDITLTDEITALEEHYMPRKQTYF